MTNEPPQPERPPNPDELPTNIREVLAREPRRRHVVRARAGFVLIVLGFLAFVGSYFLLPVLVVSCFYNCGTPEYSTAWELSMYGLSDFPHTPHGSALVLSSLPLLAVMAVVGGSIGFLVHPHRRFAIWNYWTWLAGAGALVMLFSFLLFFNTQPEIGYVGMLFGYGFLWGGNRLFLTAYS